ncbi:MAG: hypothetical protein IPM38_08825 [Ignavibacteria bacterium]|nr:hypothetical protein [Ignavibacteria bacterium]
MQNTENKTKFNSEEANKINFDSIEIKEKLEKIKKENEQILEASKVDTNKLNIRFEI